MQAADDHRHRSVSAGCRALAALALLAASAMAAAQIPGISVAGPKQAPPSVPDPAALQAEWWNYVAPEKDGAQERATALLDRASEATAGLTADQALPARRSLERLRISLAALPAMVRAEPTPLPSLTLAASYTATEVLRINRELRELELELDERRSAIAVSARAVKDGWRQVDSAFATYASGSGVVDGERIIAGLELMADRAEIALTEAEQDLRQRENAAMATRITELRELRQQALTRVTPDEERNPDKLQGLIAKNRSKIETQREELLRLRAERSNLATQPDIANGGLNLADLRITAATIEEALLTARIALYGTELDWSAVATGQLDADAVVAMEQHLAARLQEVKGIAGETPDWSSSVQRVIANSLRRPKDELSEAELRTRSAILGLAETTVTRLVRLNAILADARFAVDVNQTLLAQTAGWRGWLRTKLLNPSLAAFSEADDWLSTRLFRIGDAPVTTYGLLRVLVVLALALLASRVLRHLLSRYGARHTGASNAGLYTVSRLLHYVLIAAGLMIGLSSIGIDFSQFALFAGALSIGIGFGLQSIVSNFMSGLIILFEQSLKVGDVVELDSGVRGAVREIRVRSTLVSTNDGVDIVVPNADLISNKVINYTLREPYHRIHVPFGVAYGSDKEQVRKVVIETANAVPFTHQDAGRRTDVWLVRFGDNSLDFELVVWINPSAVTRPGAVMATYLWEIETALGKHGIQIPFPQRDVRVTIAGEDAASLAGKLGA